MSASGPLSTRPSPGTAFRDASPDSVREELEAVRFERELSQRIRKRLELEIQRLHHHINLVEADRNALRQRLEERERYLGALHASKGWKFLQALRGIAGRRW